MRPAAHTNSSPLAPADGLCLFNLACAVQGDMRLDVELDTRIQRFPLLPLLMSSMRCRNIAQSESKGIQLFFKLSNSFR
ncbi:hypothetical protein ABD76_26180 [Paenibacillus dendritiformis]|nr:hypothetical protein [Paenibacillus dendritiformis]